MNRRTSPHDPGDPRQHNARRLSTVALLALALVLTAAGCGRSTAAEPTPQASRDQVATSAVHETTTSIVRPSTPVDDLVAVNGARLHVRCVGTGAVTVVLIAGFQDGGDNWTKVTPTVSERARVCSYARFGDGTSDPAPSPQTFATEAKDLRSALRSINEPGPYVVVGHSFGGPEAVTFTAQNPTEVKGLVLLDASPTTWHDATCAVPDDGTPATQGFRTVCTMTSAAANNQESLDGPVAFAEVATINSLGNVPMVVVTASRHSYPGLPVGEEERLNQVWDAGQQHWMTLSPSAHLVSVDHTSHNIQIDRPDVVIQQIQEMLP